MRLATWRSAISSGWEKTACALPARDLDSRCSTGAGQPENEPIYARAILDREFGSCAAAMPLEAGRPIDEHQRGDARREPFLDVRRALIWITDKAVAGELRHNNTCRRRG